MFGEAGLGRNVRSHVLGFLEAESLARTVSVSKAWMAAPCERHWRTLLARDWLERPTATGSVSWAERYRRRALVERRWHRGKRGAVRRRAKAWPEGRTPFFLAVSARYLVDWTSPTELVRIATLPTQQQPPELRLRLPTALADFAVVLTQADDDDDAECLPAGGGGSGGGGGPLCVVATRSTLFVLSLETGQLLRQFSVHDSLAWHERVRLLSLWGRALLVVRGLAGTMWDVDCGERRARWTVPGRLWSSAYAVDWRRRRLFVHSSRRRGPVLVALDLDTGREQARTRLLTLRSAVVDPWSGDLLVVDDGHRLLRWRLGTKLRELPLPCPGSVLEVVVRRRALVVLTTDGCWLLPADGDQRRCVLLQRGPFDQHSWRLVAAAARLVLANHRRLIVLDFGDDDAGIQAADDDSDRQFLPAKSAKFPRALIDGKARELGLMG